MKSTVETTCPYCGVGCGVTVETTAEVALKNLQATIQVKGTPDHPANFGKLCVKGSLLAETLSLEHRLLTPKLHGKTISWETALDFIAKHCQENLNAYGKDSIAFYVSGQILSEDYYVANKLMKGFFGSANIDTNSRLCMATAVAAHQRAFGEDLVPGNYQDLELADLVVLVGSNLAWTHPILYQRLQHAKKQNPALKVIVVDPRSTATTQLADLHLKLQSGSDGFLFTGLAKFLLDHAYANLVYVQAHVDGLSALARHLEALDLSDAAIAEVCGLDLQKILEFYQLFAKTPKTVTVFSQGINQSSSGVDKANAIINCHLLTGRVGKPGASPWSITGQPNAMGGREVGGLANQLAAHLDFSPEALALVQEFWQSPTIATQPGPKAVELFQAAALGKIKVLWIMGTNPLVSLPNRAQVEQALKTCPLVIISEVVEATDTSAFAHLQLPAAAWGEKTGMVTNSERCLSLQKAFLPLPGAAKPDWWIMSQVAKKMGFSGFDYQHPHEIFREYCQLTGFKNDGQRALNLSPLAALSQTEYLHFTPRYWPIKNIGDDSRLCQDGKFYTENQKAKLIPITPELPKRQPGDYSKAHLFRLNTGRLRDQWHTMTRTSLSHKLMQNVDKSEISLSPQDMEQLQLQEGDWLNITGHHPQTHLVLPCKKEAGQSPGTVFIPIHWNAQFGSHVSVNALIPSITDPISGQPETKAALVSLKKADIALFGGIYTPTPIEIPQAGAYWQRSKLSAGWYYRLGLSMDFPALERFIGCIFQNPKTEASNHWLVYSNPVIQEYRSALLEGNKTKYLLWFGQKANTDYQSYFNKTLSNQELKSFLQGKAFLSTPMVCSCFQVSAKTIETYLKKHPHAPVETISQALKAGSNCGSCLPEIQKLIQENQALETL